MTSTDLPQSGSRLAARARRVIHRAAKKVEARTAPASVRPQGAHSEDLQFFDEASILEEVGALRRSRPEAELTWLDVGGRHGERQEWAEGFDYSALDLDPAARAPGVLIGDICDCPQILDESFDVVFSRNVFEHLLEPWAAAEECARICRPGGLIIHIAPFAWRYHPVPVDCFRFSHEGMRHLFERTGRVDTIRCGYDITNRRRDARGAMEDRRDCPPVDELGGWREHWETVYVGRKL